MAYSNTPDGSNAPPFMGPVPPDRQEMTLGEHLQASLQVLQSRPLDDQEMKEIKAFFIGVHAIVQQKAQQAQGGPMRGQPPANAGPSHRPGARPNEMSGDEEDFGTGFGTPQAAGVTVPYGT